MSKFAKFAPVIKERTLIVDMDAVAYAVSVDRAGVARGLPEARQHAIDLINMRMRETDCSDAFLILTAKESPKGYRANIYPTYQEHRKGREVAPLVGVFKQHAQDNLLDLPWFTYVEETLEADDVMTMVLHEDTDDSYVVCVDDKDIMQAPGRFIGVRQSTQKQNDVVGSVYFEYSPTGHRKIRFSGLCGLVFQILAGDTADGIKAPSYNSQHMPTELRRKPVRTAIAAADPTPVQQMRIERDPSYKGGEVTAYKICSSFKGLQFKEVFRIVESLVGENLFKRIGYCVFMRRTREEAFLERLATGDNLDEYFPELETLGPPKIERV